MFTSQAVTAPSHSRPGAFIAQIAAMNSAFARGSMVIVNAKADNGHTVMLTKREAIENSFR